MWIHLSLTLVEWPVLFHVAPSNFDHPLESILSKTSMQHFSTEFAYLNSVYSLINCNEAQLSFLLLVLSAAALTSANISPSYEACLPSMEQL